ncbi:MAG: hypothetical protein R3F41_02100 [Gammaproteobacteria bacterium]|nr:hypothetical protein [Pseudomonadales bacterium]
MQTTRGILILCVTLVLVLAVLPDRADAGAIRLIAERDVASGGSDFFLLSYPSLTDMLAGIGLTQQALSLPLSSAFSISGLTMDGSAYRMIAERDVASAGSDFFLLSYPSLTDMLAGTGLTQQALPLPLSSAFSISGFLIEPDAIPPASVPAPASAVLMLVGLLLFLRRR